MARTTTRTLKRAPASKNGRASKNGHATKARSSSRGGDGEDGEGGGKTHDIWRGVISFGLVEIPVALVSTEKAGGISLSLLDKRDFSPIGYRRYNKTTEEEVPWSEIVHGFQYQKGKYVVVGKKDVVKADPELAGTIVIDQFVDASEVAPIHFQRTYYLEPLNARSKGYALLRAALENTKKVGVARMVLRTRQYVALVAVYGPTLVLHLLRFEAEIRKPGAVENLGGAVRVSAAETEMAEKLIEDMSGPWRPSAYVDEYSTALADVIERKVKSGDTHTVDVDVPDPAPRQREVVDLMPLLEKSLGRGGGRRAPERKRATTTRGRGARRPGRARRT